MRYADTVVVGVDDTAPDRILLDWAAREAAARRTQLWVCHFWEWSAHDRSALPIDVEIPPRSLPEGIVDAAVEAVRADFPALPVIGALGYGSAAPSLLEMSDQAALIAVGTRGSGGFPGLLVGSTSAQLAAHARCPVAVVRPPTGRGTDVVVGIDGSAQSNAALRLGLAEARRIGGTLIATHAYRLPPLPAAYAPNPGIDERVHRTAAEEVLDRALGDIEQGVTDVKLERLVRPGPPARVLLEAATDAAALVVGARGLGGFTGLILGSVSQQVLRHAPCPVVIAH
jgi:nucleotide-binding universal stress UspA family protein